MIARLIIFAVIFAAPVYAATCATDEHVSSNACVTCATGYGRASGDDDTGGDTTCDLCATDYHVDSTACSACAAGTTNPYGDGTGGGDTSCDICDTDYYVSSNVCTGCSTGTTNPSGDDATGGDTTCDICDTDYYVSSNVCSGCATGYTNPSGDDATGGDTTCDICDTDYYVSSNTCAACASGYENVAGDDSTGGDTSCDGNTVELVQQFSATNCVLNTDFGIVNSTTIWVNNGCDALFDISVFSSGESVMSHCVSTDFAYHVCNLPPCDVWVKHHISASPCIYDTDFGCVDESGMWVDNGCAAVFMLNGAKHQCESTGFAYSTC